jgi:hypothetical protein
MGRPPESGERDEPTRLIRGDVPLQAYKQRALAACGGACPPRPAPCQVQVGAAAGEGEGESDVGGTRGHMDHGRARKAAGVNSPAPTVYIEQH